MKENTRLPTPQEIERLVSYLPSLYAPGFHPVKSWGGGKPDKEGVLTLPWPNYEEVVEEFFREAAQECWLNYEYRPEEAARMLDDLEFVKASSLDQIKTMLTYCVRGERFSDGHWADMIEHGDIRRLLERLAELRSQMP